MDVLPVEILYDILVRVDNQCIYWLLVASQHLRHLIDDEWFWEQMCKISNVMCFPDHTWAKTYQYWENRKWFFHCTAQTVWNYNSQCVKLYWGSLVGGTAIKYYIDNKSLEQIHNICNYAIAHYNATQPRPIFRQCGLGYYCTCMIGDRIYTMRYAPYGMVTFAFSVNNNLIISKSRTFMGSITKLYKNDREEVFRRKGIIVFDCGFVLDHTLDDYAIFMNGTDQYVPPLTPSIMSYLETGLVAWADWCEETGYID